jgi:hypothetical protein
MILDSYIVMLKNKRRPSENEKKNREKRNGQNRGEKGAAANGVPRMGQN